MACELLVSEMPRSYSELRLERGRERGRKESEREREGRGERGGGGREEGVLGKYWTCHSQHLSEYLV